MAVDRIILQDFLADYLAIGRFADYGPNGLQIEGASRIERIAFSVSATLDSIEKTLQGDAQALIVHHGLFWKFQGARPLVGAFGRRVLGLARQDVNLFAYHLPLDAHAEIGNAAVLAKRLGLEGLEPFGDYQGSPTGVKGFFAEALAVSELSLKLRSLLNHEILLASFDEHAPVKTLGIITGGANGDWRRAADDSLDAYLTGEMSEHDWHDSREAGVHMFAGGHHATERFGIQALMEKIKARFDVDCFFIDSDNPA